MAASTPADDDVIFRDATKSEKERMQLVIDRVVKEARKKGVPLHSYIQKSPDPLVLAKLFQKPRADALDFKLAFTSISVLDPVFMHGHLLPGATKDAFGMVPCGACGGTEGVTCKELRTERLKVAMTTDGPCYLLPMRYVHKGCPKGECLAVPLLNQMAT